MYISENSTPFNTQQGYDQEKRKRKRMHRKWVLIINNQDTGEKKKGLHRQNIQAPSPAKRERRKKAHKKKVKYSQERCN